MDNDADSAAESFEYDQEFDDEDEDEVDEDEDADADVDAPARNVRGGHTVGGGDAAIAAHGAGQDDAADGAVPPPPLPKYLKDISALAAWSTSSHKPDCDVAALRHPSTALFWQSDGPQPHFLNVHFFKLVAIAHIRVFLDYELDESYTPTKLQFLAGTGHHDLTEVCTFVTAKPKGWLTVDLSEAGGPPALPPYNSEEDSDNEPVLFDSPPGSNPPPQFRNGPRRHRVGLEPPGHGPTLRCMLVQMRVLENLQNGKDTHLRGLQFFGVDDAAVEGWRARVRARARRADAQARAEAGEAAPSAPSAPRRQSRRGAGLAPAAQESAGPSSRTAAGAAAGTGSRAHRGNVRRRRQSAAELEDVYSQGGMAAEPQLR